MVTAEDCARKYGNPSKHNPWLTLWDVPAEFEVNQIPKKLWCNKDLIEPLSRAFRSLVDTGCISEVCAWDGCVNIRPVRGYESKYNAAIKGGNEKLAASYLSLHSFGIAIDINAFENQLKTKGNFSPQFVMCFTKAGFDWGGNFKRQDPMHFQLSAI